MRPENKGAVIGAVWGILSLISLYWWAQYLGDSRLVGSTYVPNEGFNVLLIRFAVLPAYIASEFALVPSAGVLIAFPLAAILSGALSGYLITRIYIKIKAKLQPF